MFRRVILEVMEVKTIFPTVYSIKKKIVKSNTLMLDGTQSKNHKVIKFQINLWFHFSSLLYHYYIERRIGDIA